MARSLLRVDSSLHTDQSVSRAVADRFEESWTASGGGPIVRRDLGASPLPYLTEAEHTSMFVPEEFRTPEQKAYQAEAALLADEVFAADVILLAAPLYNLNIPATLKTWFDRLFTDMRLFPGYGITRPLLGKSAVVVTTRGGGYGPGMPMHGWEYHQPYLRRTLDDLLGLEQHDIIFELTMAAQNPAMAELVPLSEQNRAEADAAAVRLGAMLTGAGETVPVG